MAIERTASYKTAEAKSVKYDGRGCFGIRFFDDEAAADAFGAEVKARGETYNGGILHGFACGREPERDYTEADGRRLYAVTIS